jgi:hypothetical protein
MNGLDAVFRAIIAMGLSIGKRANDSIILNVRVPQMQPAWDLRHDIVMPIRPPQ